MEICRLTHPDQLEFFRDSFDQMKPSFNWSFAQFQKESLRQQTWLLIDGATPRAIACFLNTGESHELLFCLTRKENRGQGHMRELLQSLIKGPLSGETLYLEVHEDNMPARKLYNHLGFQKLSERRAYYKDGKSALILQYVP